LIKTKMVTQIIHKDFQAYLTGRLGLVALNLPARFELTTSVMIGTDFRCSCKSHYHTITITTVSGKLSATSPNLPVKYAWKCRSVVSPGTPISSTNKTDRHDIIEMLLKEVLSTM
jgi:hypothetical protein